jgi:hypothetical protein
VRTASRHLQGLRPISSTHGTSELKLRPPKEGRVPPPKGQALTEQKLLRGFFSLGSEETTQIRRTVLFVALDLVPPALLFWRHRARLAPSEQVESCVGARERNCGVASRRVSDSEDQLLVAVSVAGEKSGELQGVFATRRVRRPSAPLGVAW